MVNKQKKKRGARRNSEQNSKLPTMATPYKTPRKPLGQYNGKSASKPTAKAKAVDLVTGKAISEYFFDPTLAMPNNDSSSFETPFKGQSVRNLTRNTQTDDEMLYSSKHLFMPCTIVKRLEEDGDNKSTNTEPYEGPTLVKTNDGVLHKITDSSKLIALTAPDDYVGLDDVLHLPHVTEASLLHTLRTRYKMDDIYTSAGPILISINPYRKLTMPTGESLYSEEVMLKYRSKADFAAEKPPHLFQVADRAYVAMMDSVHPSMDYKHMEDEDVDIITDSKGPSGKARNQSIIISGESGAGKTEATKFIMQYLARITKKNRHPNNPLVSPDGKRIAALEDRVLSSNPLLETFGNAQTLRNDNSSRFGKFIHIFFSTNTGAITGASISNYLLEKTRITQQVDGERNYHIFYQLLAGSDHEMLEVLGLEGGAQHFNYLMNQESSSNSIDDAADFAKTCECLTQLGVYSEDQMALFGMVAGVLHLGNVQFEEKDGDCEDAKITEESLPSLKKACELLGFNEEKVIDAILTKNLTVGGKTIKKSQTISMAAEKRDALAKLSYSSIFLWLVTCINETLDKTSHVDVTPTKGNRKRLAGWTSPLDADGKPVDDSVFIGVLDIYGFECFEYNGYEQLLINYCNEKLQRQFNENVFTVEQNLYRNEGIDWSYISFNDNRPCLDLIEGGGGTVGILNTLDDAWGGMGNSSEKDVKFVSQLHKMYGSTEKTETNTVKKDDTSHDYFVTPKFGKDSQFIVVHFAGQVRYTVEGFVEKNMESMSTELKGLGHDSSISLARSVFSCSSFGEVAPSPKRSSIRGVSVGSQFRASLQNLVSDLERTQPHYIRCIKPNLQKVPNAFSSGEVLKQLRYSGMMEAIRIRREGYALREEHESFYNRFSVLLSQEDLDAGSGIEYLVNVLSKRLSVTEADWQIGHSKIFLRRELSEKLERLASLRVHAAVRTIGRFGRIVASTRVNRLLVAWARFRLHMIKLHRQQSAVNKIAAIYRTHIQQQQYITIRKSIVKVQALQRRRIAQAYVKKVRDPFADMTYKDMKKFLASEHSLLDKAIQEKDFKLAAEIESKIALANQALEAKRPLTRSLLEKRIGEAQEELKQALERKDYAACDSIQAKVDELTSKRSEMPTIDELKHEVRVAEEAVASAADARDFTSAAEAQTRLVEAKERLNEALLSESGADAADDSSYDENQEGKDVASRAQLEQQIAELRASVNAAIAEKDFSKASSLQHSLDKQEELRALFPTVDELEEELEKQKAGLEDAIQSKNFSKAKEQHTKIDQLEEKIKLEKEQVKESENATNESSTATIVDLDGNVKTFESRTDLEAEIAATSSDVTNAVSAKQFQKAEKLNIQVEKLESLRMVLPTVHELEEKLKAARKELNSAISRKEFSKADNLSSTVDDLESRLQKEWQKQPKPTAVKAGSKVISAKAPSAQVTPKRPADLADASYRSNGDSFSVRSVPVNAVTPRKTGDANSIRSVPVSASKSVTKKTLKSTAARPVSKLRPKKPVICFSNTSILNVTQELASHRGDAALVTDEKGGICGILTDIDITRRVVSKGLDANVTMVSEVMTPNPTCVSMSDSALDALGTMIDNHFRHLPVVDNAGTVVGLLDIAKCLNDAISKLEKSEVKSSNAAEDAVKQVLGNHKSGDAHARALQALLGQVMSQAFGQQTTPTLQSILSGRPTTIVSPRTSLREVGNLMSEYRKAGLVVEDGKLIGIFGFKDMMTRAVAKGLDLDSTPVSEVMTEHPEFVSPDLTVLEALQTMHDNRFLTLPVCTKEGAVLDVVSVIDVINACGGSKGWRSIFSTAMEVDDDDSESGSVTSFSSAQKNTKNKARVAQNKMSQLAESSEEKTVSKLRPKKPLCSGTKDSVLSATQMLASKRGDATLVLDATGVLAGILTDVDVCRRVVAKNLDPTSTNLSEVMTENPTCIAINDSAMDALGIMMDNHFRHLPVVDERGTVCGLLDIAKCLNDAISKLEKAESRNGGITGDDALKKVLGTQNSGDAHAMALQALLSQVMSKAFGTENTPTLGSLLTGEVTTAVNPTTSLREAGILMAESRKAALVVENGKLVGIFGFKDMMTRGVAKSLDLDSTPVSDVCTENPESVPPDMTVLEALQTMHDHKFLTLPVCAEDGSVLGVVDCIDVINACGGSNGWRSIFGSAMDISDGESDADSVNSFSSRHSRGHRTQSQQKHNGNRMTRLAESSEERPVAKLRPKKPLISMESDSVLSVTQMLASKRGDVSIVVDRSGTLVGIMSDKDVTRRVVAKSKDPVTTTLSTVMTPEPLCVSMGDSAMDAMATMVENRFRHLPVLDDDGAVCGVLDIAKLLNDAITKLEKSVEKSSSTVDDVVKQVVGQQGPNNSQAQALQALLSQVMSQTLGNQASPTLGSLLNGKPPMTVVTPETSLRDAGLLMAEHQKAALIVEKGKLTGIFGFKDMMTRAVAKNLSLDSTVVSEVMTSSPETVSSEMTVLEAMQVMHDNKFLTLPVCGPNNNVLGIIDVMDLILACGGKEGWRSIFSRTIDLDDLSEEASVLSMESGQRSTKTSKSGKTSASLNKDDRTVEKLRPKKPIISSWNDSVLTVSQHLASKRGDASIVVGSSGKLGILTDIDITRRVVAQSMDPVTTEVAEVMTENPTCVALNDSAMDAMATMVENHFRHLPVLDEKGMVCGLLDIAKCLNDAITRLEKSVEKDSATADNVVKQVVSQQGAAGSHALALESLLSQVMSQAFGNQSSPTLGSLLAGKPPSTIVSPGTTLREAGKVMAEHRKAALVVENGELTGIFGFKDMMARGVAKNLCLDSTPVSEVMTSNPETVSPDITVLEAMQLMHDNNFLTLPVCDEMNNVVGVLGIMDLILACGGKDGWRSIFSSSLDCNSVSDTDSACDPSNANLPGKTPLPVAPPSVARVSVAPKTPGSPLPNNIPTTLEFESLGDDTSTIQDTRADPKSLLQDSSVFGLSEGDGQQAVFKIVDPKGNTHRIRCELSVRMLMDALNEKGVQTKNMQLEFIDDEGDAVVANSDDCLSDAANIARSQGQKVVKLTAKEVDSSGDSKTLLMAGVGMAAAAAIGAAVFFFGRPKK